MKQLIIKDWINLTIEDYVNRVEEDVKINSILFHNQMKYLFEIYDGNEQLIILKIGLI